MKLSFKLLGVEMVPRWQGPWIYIYWVTGEHGEEDMVRDEDYLDDGEYEVPESFWDDLAKSKETEEETEEW